MTLLQSAIAASTAVLLPSPPLLPVPLPSLAFGLTIIVIIARALQYVAQKASRSGGKMPHVADVALRGKRVFVRTELDTPAKIDSTVSTLGLCLRRGAKYVVVASHRGTPRGRANEQDSLKPLAGVLAQQLKREVHFVRECVGPTVEAVCAQAPAGAVVLIENMCFDAAEEAVDVGVDELAASAMSAQVRTFQRSLARLAEVHINDVSSSHVTAAAFASVAGEGFATRARGMRSTEAA